MLTGHVSNLHPQRQPRRPGVHLALTGDLQQPSTEEEDDARIGGIAELPVDRKTQHIAIEPLRPLTIGRTEKDPATQDIHA